MSYIDILMSFTAIFPSIGYEQTLPNSSGCPFMNKNLVWQRSKINLSSKACFLRFQNPWNPRQKNCGAPTPPPPPSCTDGKQNQGEEDIDCGGPNCPSCPEPTASIDEYAK